MQQLTPFGFWPFLLFELDWYLLSVDIMSFAPRQDNWLDSPAPTDNWLTSISNGSTRQNSQGGGGKAVSKLSKALANLVWFQLFLHCLVLIFSDTETVLSHWQIKEQCASATSCFKSVLILWFWDLLILFLHCLVFDFQWHWCNAISLADMWTACFNYFMLQILFDSSILRLTNHQTNTIQAYYSNAIRTNRANLVGMRQEAVWATYLHKRSSDNNPSHHFCSASWCTYKQAEARNDVANYKHTEQFACYSDGWTEANL